LFWPGPGRATASHEPVASLVILAMAILAFATVMLVVAPKVQIGREPAAAG
jgi:hypothetical protein